MKKHKHRLAENYACGIGRNDEHGVSSFPDTHEKEAFLAGFEAAIEEIEYMPVTKEERSFVKDILEYLNREEDEGGGGE